MELQWFSGVLEHLKLVPQDSGVITHFLFMCVLCVFHHIGVSAALNDAAKGQRLVLH